MHPDSRLHEGQRKIMDHILLAASFGTCSERTPRSSQQHLRPVLGALPIVCINRGCRTNEVCSERRCPRTTPMRSLCPATEKLMSGSVRLLVRLFRRQPPTPIPAPITTHGLAIFWHEQGCPRHIGAEISVPMRSGKTAIYQLYRVTPATGVDWSWYEFKFGRYQSLPNAERIHGEKDA